MAAGSITAVYLGLKGVSTPLPDSLFRVDTDSSETPVLTPPKFSEMPPAPFEYSYRVRTSDLDFLRHMNQSNYAALYDDTRQAAAECSAYGPGGRGSGRVRFLHIEYLHPAMKGEKLVVATWSIGGDPLTLEFAMHRNGALISRAVIRV